MSTAMIACVAYANGDATGHDCQVVITQDIHVEESMLPKPDERWSFTDAAGHFHAYDQSAEEARFRYPTLRTRVEKIPCGFSDHDADCDGEDITYYHCRICDEEIKPGSIPGPHTYSWRGLSDWRVELDVVGEDVRSWIGRCGDQVTLRVVTGAGVERFGIAMVNDVGVSLYSGGPTRATVALAGNGPLGVSRAKAKATGTDEAWVRHLPEQEVRQFCAELVRAVEQGDWRALERTVREWRATARIHADPVLAGQLRGPIGEAS